MPVGPYNCGGESVEIDVKVLNVHDSMNRALAAVGEHWNAPLMRQAHDLLQRRFRAEHIRHVSQCYELGPRGDGPRDIGRIELAQIGHFDPLQHRALAFPQEMPRHNIRMVLHYAEHDLIASLDPRRKIGIGHEIDRLGAAARKNDLVRMRGIEEALHARPSMLVAVGRSTR